jgi:hypothetical protein
MSDGSPQSVPIWVGREGDRILLCTEKAHLRRRTPGVIRASRSPSSIFMIPKRGAGSWARGRGVPDGECKYIDPISIKYTGKPFPFRSPEGRLALVIEVEKARYTKLPFEHTPPK